MSQHVGGFVIARGPAVATWCRSRTPRCRSRTVIQWDKDDLDALGLLKVDVLALGHAHRASGRALRPASAPARGQPVRAGRRAGRGPGGLRR
ncbi:MAG: hypothetical protein MZW92_25165 [Comamonadaceae bacterium]|nr:hypothetical protein [Comamonadaceae bacterium]